MHEPTGGPAADRPRAPAARPLPVLVLADVSSSMGEWGKIDILNSSMATMFRAFAGEQAGQILVGVITFGGTVAQVHVRPTPAADARWNAMTPSGVTPMDQAFDLARELLEDETAIPRRRSRPWLILCSDGHPTGPDGYASDAWQGALDRLLSSPQGRRARRLAVSIGPDVTAEARAVLAAFVSDQAYLVDAENVERVSQFFEWATHTVTSDVGGGIRAPSFDPSDLADRL
ncbi:vWA domain-containing protein [Parafrankia sp. FMc2]|uniref:vWA domain-containing protein n=1 Tax=Parafrankia sp. FMc2 TaxID=3233196 RepID=UPI0034D680A7